jgi:hypothetical protein
VGEDEVADAGALGDGNGTPVPVSVTTVGSSIDRRDGRNR